MIGWVLLAAAAVLVLVIAASALRRRPDEVRRFVTAREVTSRWAADPDSAPAPVRAIALGGLHPSEPDA